MQNLYSEQDRGDKSNYIQYLEAMDAIAIEKVASASTFFSSESGKTIVDIGMASGTSTAILAKLFPEQHIIGVDINPKMVEIAQKFYKSQNLSFKVDDGETLNTFNPNSIDGFFNCSSIHHITSYNNYDVNRAYNTLTRQYELLKDNGIIVIRDFVKLEINEIILEVSSLEKQNKPSDAELLILFSKTARSLSKQEDQGFPIEELKSLNKDTRRFKLYNTDAIEFIRRKDYFENWNIELQEEYGYFSQREFEDCFNRLGLRIILSAPIYNQWIINNRYKNKFQLYNIDGSKIGYPPTNYIIVGEKINSSKNLSLTRYLPKADSSYLNYASYKNKKNDIIFEVVNRPNIVKDIIPYYKEDAKLKVIAKHGYPRPILNAFKNLIDNKVFSGYITEAISVTKLESLQDILMDVFNIDAQASEFKHLLNYFTSPGGIDEFVSSIAVELTKKPIDLHKISFPFSAFFDLGKTKVYDAIELLNTAQTGALIEARLELNIYQLLRKELIPLPKWFGEKIIPKEITINELKPDTWDTLALRKAKDYEKVEVTHQFLETSRACFSEIGAKNNQSQILEFTYPKELSINTLITLPIFKAENDIYLGLEIRSLPVPQIHTGNSLIMTVPAVRLNKEIKTLFDLQTYISNYMIGTSNIIDYFKLGEKYYPSIGITPEQVYPFIVTLNLPDKSLNWIKLSELFVHIEELNDAHLLICLNRLTHALNVTNNF